MSAALLMGINYANDSSASLSGCINDTKKVATMLKEHYGLAERNITRLIEEDATHAGILKALGVIAQAAARGGLERVFITYSGHGTSVSDTSGDEADGRDEAIVPYDYKTAGVISDDKISRYIEQMSHTVDVIVLWDCCHSGTGLDLPLRYVSGKHAVEHTNSELYAGSNRVLMISGCRDDQLSSDAWGLNDELAFSGAMTSSFLAALDAKDYDVTVYRLLHHMREYLAERGFTQVPQLCTNRELSSTTPFSVRNRDAPFLVHQTK